MWVFIFMLLIILLGVSLTIAIDRWAELTKIKKKYRSVIDAEEESEKILAETHRRIAEQEQKMLSETNAFKAELESMRLTYIDLTKDIDDKENAATALDRKIEALTERDILYSKGFYEFHYNFDQLVDYERRLSNIKNRQKDLISSSCAIYNDSHMDKKSFNMLSKLILRAFNSECREMVTRVDYKNIVTFEERARKAYEQINKIASSYGLSMDKSLLDFSIEELRLVYEFQCKKQQEAEEQRRIKEIMREEIKAQREYEKALQDAEKEENSYLRQLEKALEESKKVTGARYELMMDKISLLEQQLEQAREAKERAISQAQLTKSGHVYIISNIGSFGEHIYKIGMTRRLEPLDRVRELGDASVPFAFDVHAMVYSEDAPALENALHRAFEDNRVNKVNSRKEFFKVHIDDIEQEVKKHSESLYVTKLAEAKEYRMSLSMSEEESIEAAIAI
ncbi:MAG: DUF4041 domain-containing protein [Victivallales bacterium]|nr:DUF4041 domain-containing protein [Victivallales bacterium]